MNVAGTVSLRLQELRVRAETKTKDKVFVHMQVWFSIPCGARSWICGAKPGLQVWYVGRIP